MLSLIKDARKSHTFLFFQAFRLSVSPFQTHSYSLHALFYITERPAGSGFFSPLRLSSMIHVEDGFSSVQQLSLRDLGALQSLEDFLRCDIGSWLKQSHLQTYVKRKALIGLHWVGPSGHSRQFLVFYPAMMVDQWSINMQMQLFSSLEDNTVWSSIGRVRQAGRTWPKHLQTPCS